MKRSFKVLVAMVLALALSLSFATAFAKKESKPPKPTKAPQVAVTGLKLSLYDRQNNVLSPDDGTAYSAVRGWKFIAKATIEPSGAKASLRWRSSKPSVASVNSRGVINCNRMGTADITVSTKSGDWKQTITLIVKENATTFTTTADKTIKKIYLRGNYVCADVVLVNLGPEVLETAPSLVFTLKLANESSATNLGTKTSELRKPIPAGESGIATYKLKKVGAKTTWLINAEASCSAVTP